VSATPPRAALAPRVALVRSRYDPAGGAERFVQAAMASLKARGVEITIVSRQWPGAHGGAIIVDPWFAGSLWRDAGFAQAVCRELARRPFDLVQSHERIACCDVYRAGDGVHAEWLSQRARVQSPLAALATRLSPHHNYVLAAERRLFTSPRLSAVICNSEMVRTEIAARFATAPGKLELIRNAVDAEHFNPLARAQNRDAVRQQLAIPRESNVFLHVGSGFERKGVAAFLEALARVPGKPWGIVAGRDKHLERYVARAKSLGLTERVRFAGSVSDVRSYHAAADSFVLASLYDPFPNAALEALASGLPVVTTRKCGVAELISEGESGFVRDALDVTGIAEAMARLEPPVAKRMGEAARAAVDALTPAAMAAQYEALYARLIRR
jgi:UDP-glucose:(heptosyl)LPS alpha-1,3-glucosyltransferase